MADKDPVVFDEQSAKLIARVVKAEMARYRNPRSGELLAGSLPDDNRWVPYSNESGEAIPGNAILALTTSLNSTAANANILRATKPSTSWNLLYGVASPAGSSIAGSGFCTLTGPCEVLVNPNASVPTSTQTIGPVPNQWYGAQGWPSIGNVLGTIEPTTVGRSVWAKIHPIERVIARTTSTIGATTTGSCLVLTTIGGSLADSSPTVHFTGRNLSATATSTSDKYTFHEVHGQLTCAVSGGGGGVEWYIGTLSTALSHGAATADINGIERLSATGDTSLSATTITAQNAQGWQGTAGDVCFFLADSSTSPTVYYLMSVAWDAVTSVSTISYSTVTFVLSSSNHSRIGKTISMSSANIFTGSTVC